MGPRNLLMGVSKEMALEHLHMVYLVFRGKLASLLSFAWIFSTLAKNVKTNFRHMEVFLPGKLYGNQGEQERFVNTSSLKVTFQILLGHLNPPVLN